MAFSPENMRFHAAGHLAAAHALVTTGEINGARYVLGIVKQYVNEPNVQTPPAMRLKLQNCIMDPFFHKDEIAQLEAWFVDPFNTVIENSGKRLGNG